jgi:hypothetical protein
MADQEVFGKCKSITVLDGDRKGKIILRTPTGDLSLKLSDSRDSAYNAMAAIGTAGVEFATGNPGDPPNIHVRYDDDEMEIEEMTLHYHI